MKPIGLYGCYCHPFEDWEELKKFSNQKIIIGAKYKNRCTGVIGIATGLYKEQKCYVEIFVEPYDCPRCNQMEHKQNLILVEDD